MFIIQSIKHINYQFYSFFFYILFIIICIFYLNFQGNYHKIVNLFHL
jgi:hypothetical protein